MKRYLSYIGFVLMLAGCGEQLMQPPGNLIPKAQMTDILFDISILDAINNSYPNALERNGIEIMPFVYDKYGIDSVQFAQSDLFYASRPVEYQEIYEALEARILQKKDSITEVIQGAREPARETDTP